MHLGWNYFLIALSSAVFRTCVSASTSPVTNKLEPDVFAAICSDANEGPVKQTLSRLRLLGYNATWLNCTDALVNGSFHYGIRQKHYQRFVTSLSGDPFVIFLDGFDILAQGPAKEALERFERFKVPLVVSCVTYPWPLTCKAYEEAPPKPHECDYPCGGGLMGFRSALEKLYLGHPYTDDTDDQCWLFETLTMSKANDTDWKFDKQGSLFMSASRLKKYPYLFYNGRYHIGAPGLERQPTFIHLDTNHPSAEKMKKLGRCQVESPPDSCSNQRLFGFFETDSHPMLAMKSRLYSMTDKIKPTVLARGNAYVWIPLLFATATMGSIFGYRALRRMSMGRKPDVQECCADDLLDYAPE